MTIALVLGGGAPNLTLMAGAVAALDDAGVEFDVGFDFGRGHVDRPALRGAQGQDR